MISRRLLQRAFGLTVIVLLLSGCGGPPVEPTATPIPPTATPVPPTATPTQAFTLATSAEEILGTWVAVDCIRFDRDGTFRQAYTLEKLDSDPYAINSYQFEGTKMVITEVSVSGVPPCGKKVGSYEIRLLESGNIRIVAIEDRCRPRAGDIAGEYEPVR